MSHAAARQLSLRFRSDPRVLVFDLETQRSAAEVGGWRNTHLMRMAVGVVHDSRDDTFTAYEEGQVDELLTHLHAGELIVGFNVRRFDYGVLSAYTTEDLTRLPTFDMLEAVYAQLKFRLGLDHLCRHTLGHGKTADGLQSLEWVKQGRMELVIDYCREDVRATRDLFRHGCEQGYLMYQRKADAKTVVRLPVHWDVAQLIEEARHARS